MNAQIKKRLLRTLIIVVVGVGIGAMMGLYQIQGQQSAKISKPAPVAGIKIGGPFTLVNQDGETVTQDTYKGQYKLIYFGFTYCPAICPTELQKVTRALNELGKDGEKIQPIFITIDPERDTPKVMKDYVSLYHPRLVGLSGSPENVSAALKDFRIYAAKVQDETMNDYTMDHSSFIYFMDGEDNLLGLYRIEDSAEVIAADIKSKLQ